MIIFFFLQLTELDNNEVEKKELVKTIGLNKL